jgi:hypothetical protein
MRHPVLKTSSQLKFFLSAAADSKDYKKGVKEIESDTKVRGPVTPFLCS